MGSFICIAVVIFSTFLLCFAQDCYQPCEVPLTTCTYIDYPVYPLGLNLEESDKNASQIVLFAQLATSGECLEQIRKYACAFIYPSCSNSSIPGAPPNKVKPCKQMCLDVLAACPGIQSRLPPDYQYYVDCEQKEADGTPKFSNDSSCFALNNLTPIERCNNNTNYTASGCAAYEPTSSPLTNHLCAPFVSAEIYAPLPQTTLDAVANDTLWLISKLHPVLPLKCYQSLLSLLCQTAYPSCNRIKDTNSGQEVQLGNTPCYEYCLEVYDTCATFFLYTGQTYLNCSQTTESGVPVWPRATANGIQVTPSIRVNDTCSSSLFPPNAISSYSPPIVDKCPSVLGRNPNPSENEQHCWIPCPDPSYTKKMWRDLTTITLVGGSLSFITMTFLLISTLLIPAKRSKQHVQMCVYFSCLMQAVSFLINGRHPEENVWCNNEVSYADASTNAACGAQAFLWHMFTLSSATWWLVIAFHLFGTVVLRQTLTMKDRAIWYHLFGWGIPAAFAVASAAGGFHSFGPPTAWCSIHNKGVQYDYNPGYAESGGISTDYKVFYIPLGIILLAAAVLLACVLYKIIVTLKDAKSVREITKADLAVQRRILAFVILLFGIFILVLEYRFGIETIDTSYLKNVDLLYVLCQVKNDLGIAYDPSCLAEELPFRINYAHTCFETFLAASFGFLVFLVFGSEGSLYKWWYTLFGLRSLEDIRLHIIEEKRTSGRADREMTSKLKSSSSSSSDNSEKALCSSSELSKA